jgi:Ca-activated chloride channel family protein
MNHRGAEVAERTAGVVVTLCALCFCGSNSFAAKPEWPRRYNAGVTAYQSNDFASAVSGFEQAAASPDHALQQRAFYNLGNTAYRLGEAQPPQAQQLWERAIKNYETALAIDPNDEDAKYNCDFVKKKLEELKQQQEQQQQQQNQESQDQQQKNEQSEQKQEQEQKQDQQQPQQDQQEQPDSRRDAEARSEPQEQKEQQQQAQAGNFDKQQAKALLDELRENERNWNFFPEVQMKDLKDSGEPAKDW